MELEEKQQLTFPNGTRESTLWNFEGIKMGHAVSKFNEFFCFPASNTLDVVRLHFGMKGDYRFSYKQVGKSFDLIGGHHNMMYSQGFDIVIENKTFELETFGIQFPKELFIKYTENASDTLKRFAEAIILGKSVLLSDQWGSIDSNLQQVLQQVIHCKYSGDLKRLFLFSKSIELLVLSADACQSADEKKDILIKSKTDKEKIIAVRDLINERVSSPPNLTEIAKTVGLNEYKLKRGFKETFNHTIFGYLTDQRLNLAHQYLRDTSKTAAEISLDLGYSTPQHFNNAFKKKFGFTPFSVRNNP